MGLLARREHSRLELSRKLLKRGFERPVVDQVLAYLTADGSLSEQRFQADYVNARINRGFGPLRISAELRDRGVASDSAALSEQDWLALCEQAARQTVRL